MGSLSSKCCDAEKNAMTIDIIDTEASVGAKELDEVMADNYLEWRAKCVARDWLPPAEESDLGQQVHDVLTSDAFRKPPPFVTDKGPQLDLVFTRDMIQWHLDRVKLVNGVDAPPMRVVWWGTLVSLGRFPRWPEDREHVLDLQKVLEEWLALCDDESMIDVQDTRRAFCVSFFSHRWERPAKDAGSHYECGKAAHPDTVDHKKAKACAVYGSKGACPLFPDKLFDYYFYVDFGCIDQDDPVPKLAGVIALPMHVAVCIELIFYDSKSTDYEPRGWTRVERVFAYAFCFSPIVVYIGEEYPASATDFVKLCAEKPEIYSMDEEGKIHMVIKDPLASDSALSNPADKVIVQGLCESAMKAPPINVSLAMAMGGASMESCLKLGVDKMMLDTEHQKMDFESNQYDGAVEKMRTSSKRNFNQA